MSDDDSQLRVLLGLTPLAEREVEETLFARGSGVRVVAGAADVGQLLALSRQYDADAALVSPDLSGVGARHVSELAAQGLRLVGLAIGERDEARLRELGIEQLLMPPLEPEQLRAMFTVGHTQQPALELTKAPAADANGRDGRAPQRTGSVIAVVGSSGSPGSSECASSLAALAAQQWSTLLLECDLQSGSLDVRLGADPRQGSLLGLVRASASSAPGELLEHWTTGGKRGWSSVLLAPASADAPIDELVRPGAIRAAVETAASLYPLVVCDVGALLATPGTVPPVARAHREAILSADAVLLVIGARDEQLRAGRRQLTLLLDELGVKRERLRLVVNGTGGPAAGTRSELTEVLAAELAELRLAVDAWLPYDERGTRKTRQTGLPLALARPRGSYARAAHALLDDLLLPAQPVARERKERLPVPAVGKPVDEEVALPWRQS